MHVTAELFVYFKKKIRVLYVRILQNETANVKLLMKSFRSLELKGKSRKETLVLFSCRLQTESSPITACEALQLRDKKRCLFSVWSVLKSSTLQGKSSFICLLIV